MPSRWRHNDNRYYSQFGMLHHNQAFVYISNQFLYQLFVLLPADTIWLSLSLFIYLKFTHLSKCVFMQSQLYLALWFLPDFFSNTTNSVNTPRLHPEISPSAAVHYHIEIAHKHFVLSGHTVRKYATCISWGPKGQYIYIQCTSEKYAESPLYNREKYSILRYKYNSNNL